jgi:hypothetical protein
MAKQTSLLRFLNELEKEDLIEEIEKLCTKFEVVKKYFDIELSGDTTRYLEQTKKTISRQFMTSKGDWRKNPKASRLNLITKEFEQVSIYKTDIIELLVHRVEETIRYAYKSREPVSAALWQSTELVIKRAQDLINAEGLEDKYRNRMQSADNPNWRYGKPPEWIKPETKWRW